VAVPWLAVPVILIWCLAICLLVLALFAFPDGRFVPAWTRLIGLAVIPAVCLVTDLPNWVIELQYTADPDERAKLAYAVLGILAFWSVGIYAQIYRYRKVSGPVQRQQSKWLALTLFYLVGSRCQHSSFRCSSWIRGTGTSPGHCRRS
jgi:hypothetical protein